MDIKIDGVYDSKTISKLKHVGIQRFGFDFRPRSFNFLQGHLFLKILKESYRVGDSFVLHFHNEKQFCIDKILSDLKRFMGEDVGKIEGLRDFSLLFSDVDLPDYVDSFNMPFYWKYSSETNLVKILKMKNLKGICFDFNFFQDLYESKQFPNFVQNFYTLALPYIEKNNLDLVLDIDWDSNIFSSLFEFFDFKMISLTVNSKIEVCYRNVDYSRALDHLKYLNIF